MRRRGYSNEYISKHPTTFVNTINWSGEKDAFTRAISEAVQAENSEAVKQFVQDIFNYGYMNGMEQGEKDIKAKYDKQFEYDKDTYHKDLAELAYYLPFGYGADYFYTFMVRTLNSRCEGIANLLPAKQRKRFNEAIKQSKERKESEIQQINKVNDTETDLKAKIFDRVNNINGNSWLLNQIYRFVVNMTKGTESEV